MSTNSFSSRQQFEQFKAEFQENISPTKGKNAAKRERTSWELVCSFLSLLKIHRRSVTLSLLTLTVATLLALIPPAATKFVVDYVLEKNPMPAGLPQWIPREPWPLLVLITVTVITISFIRIALQIWGRWHATRVTKMIQMKVRKAVFAQAVRLPLHRVQ
ncbi:MAG: ABC transporter ATP-binding protein, partial [Gimesia sp.]